MRLFIAIFPPKKIRDIFREDRAILKKRFRNNFKYVSLDQIHLTLKFVGDGVSEESKDSIIDTMRRHRTLLHSVDISLDKISFGFKGQSRPKILKYDLKSNCDLDDLFRKTHEIVRNIGVKDVVRYKEKPDYHMTIARTRNTAPRKIKGEVMEFLSDYNRGKDTVKFNADKIALVSSVLTKNGPVYSYIYEQDLHKRAF